MSNTTNIVTALKQQLEDNANRQMTALYHYQNIQAIIGTLTKQSKYNVYLDPIFKQLDYITNRILSDYHLNWVVGNYQYRKLFKHLKTEMMDILVKFYETIEFESSTKFLQTRLIFKQLNEINPGLIISEELYPKFRPAVVREYKKRHPWNKNINNAFDSRQSEILLKEIGEHISYAIKTAYEIMEKRYQQKDLEMHKQFEPELMAATGNAGLVATMLHETSVFAKSK